MRPITRTRCPKQKLSRTIDDGAVATEISPEEERVLQWRYAEIRRLGINRVESRLLAECGADLSLLRRLVDAGCPPDTAARIAL